MSYYAASNTVSMSEIEDGIEITEAQYHEGIQALVDGMETAIIEGEFIIRALQPSPYHEWVDGEWVDMTPDPDPPEPITPDIIYRRQFFQALASPDILEAVTGSNETIISEAEAEAALEGVIPPPLETIILTLPSAEQFNARMLVKGAFEFNRANPFAVTVRTEIGWTQAQQDHFWRLAFEL